MRRLLVTVLILAAVGALALATVASSQDDGSDGSYKVRAIFDNGGFVVRDEQVRIAGANVGVVDSVDVSRPGEIVTLEGGGRAIPGKAVIVLDITDGDFKDWAADATCLIRPQSLIGERFIDCEPSGEHAPGVDPPPLEQIPEGEPGEGQYLLPLENNGKAVDLDLINNIMREPYAERFRLILNDLGATLAARGEELDLIVKKADPALRETDEVLQILADQNKQLAKLAVDSETSLGPLARERESLTGFIRNAGETAAATAERAGPLEENLSKLPATLREVRLTMNSLGTFSDATFPVLKVLGDNVGPITRATQQLGPFADASAFAIKDLGRAAEQAGPDLRAADPVVRQLGRVARTAARPATDLSRLTRSLERTGGYEEILEFIFNSTGVFNGFDRFGHYQRTNILVSGCVEYVTFPSSGCTARFTGPNSPNPRDPTVNEVAFDGEGSWSENMPPKLEDADRADSLTPLAPARAATPEPETALDAGIEVLDYLLGP
jgi:ABC-type transporter Mla subunit MlaD